MKVPICPARSSHFPKLCAETEKCFYCFDWADCFLILFPQWKEKWQECFWQFAPGGGMALILLRQDPAAVYEGQVSRRRFSTGAHGACQLELGAAILSPSCL